MHASFRWLKSLVPQLDCAPEEAAERLTRGGLEVEEVVVYGAASPHVKIVEVRSIQPHPKRDKLKLVTVDTGTGEQTVVCGAPNVPEPGGRVVLAPLGTTLPAIPMTVEPRPIGGIVSEGMLCSEEELGLTVSGGKGDGIIVFGRGDIDVMKCPLGTPLSVAVPASHDTVIDIDVTPNRPDALGHVGLARELSALFDLPFTPPSPDAPAKVAKGRAADFASVGIDGDAKERCHQYAAAVVLGITVEPSPRWLRYRLESLGIRAISNVVDVTNLVLMEWGQPMHAFDLGRLKGATNQARVQVRLANEGEALTTLDQLERKLDPDDLLITDGASGIALAGVMGGANSEIHDGSSDVLLECATFESRGVRRTARRHGLHSEASHRFERGTDPSAVMDVLAHAASLLTQICGGAAVSDTLFAGSPPSVPPPIELRHSKLESLLGLPLSLDAASATLQRLGCEVSRSEAQPGVLSVVPPLARPDLTIEEDIIEEVMRLYGVDNIPSVIRPVLPRAGRSEPTVLARARVAAADVGLSEALTFGFVSEHELATLGAPTPVVHLRHPLTVERNVMRTSIFPGLLSAIGRARRHGVADVRLFTTGRIFVGPLSEDGLPQEKERLGVALAGSRRFGLEAATELDVYDAKGIAVEMVERTLRLKAAARTAATPASLPHLHPRYAAELVVAGPDGPTVVGTFGGVHPKVLDTLELGGEVWVVELDLDIMTAIGRHTPKFTAIPSLPSVTRDLALLVSQEVTAEALRQAIGGAAGELCESVELFDRFCGKGVPDDQQSLAYRLVFRDPKASTDPEQARTLTDDEVEASAARVIEKVKASFGAEVRGG